MAAERLVRAQEQDLPSALLRLKREVRNDKLPKLWLDFAIAFWSDESVARESEISKRRIRNPYTRKDKATYGLHFLTVLLKEEYKMMLVAARTHFNGLFYMSATINSVLRPFWVKNSTRETCLCIYHLKFMQAAEDLANFRQSLRASGKCRCTTPLLRHSSDLWHTLLCPKKEGELCYQWECVNNRCPNCCNAKRLKESVLCKCVGGEERIKWKTYDKIDTDSLPAQLPQQVVHISTGQLHRHQAKPQPLCHLRSKGVVVVTMRVPVDTDRKLLEKATIVVVASQHTMAGGGAACTHQAQASIPRCLS